MSTSEEKMCDLEKYGNTRIDPCLHELLDTIKQFRDGLFKTIMSCCGHGKYDTTVIVQNKSSGCVFEWFTGINLDKKVRNRQPYYKKDSERVYFIPEIMSTGEEKQ